MFKFLWKMTKWLVIYPVTFITVASLAWAFIDPEGSGWNASVEQVEQAKQTRIENCIADIGSSNCDENGYKTAEYKAEEKAERDRIKAEEKAERDRIKAEEKAERERIKAERDRIKAEEKAERDRIKAEEKAERDRIKAEEKAERERIAKEAEYERQRQEEAKRIAEAAYRNSPKGKTENFMDTAWADCRNTVKNAALYPSKVDFNWLSGNDSKYFMNFNSKGESRVMITLSGEMMNGFGNMIPFTAVCKYDYNPKSNTYKVVEILM